LYKSRKEADLGKKLIILLVVGVILASAIAFSYANGWSLAIKSPGSTTNSQEPMPKYG
jgi:hypothetical protein